LRQRNLQTEGQPNGAAGQGQGEVPPNGAVGQGSGEVDCRLLSVGGGGEAIEVEVDVV
jgi:hypothetical protein